MSRLSYNTLVHLAHSRAKKSPSSLIYEFIESDDSKNTLTYAELDQKARALASVFTDKKLAGERALLLYAPSLDYLIAFWGCLYAGVVAVPAYPPDPSRLDRTLPRLTSIINDCEAKVILSTSVIESFGKEKMGGDWIATDLIDIAHANRWSMPKITSESLAFLQYTSGSTGTPKGVVLTHRNLILHADYVNKDLYREEPYRGVSWLPPYHDMGLIGGIIQAMYSESLSTLMSPLDFLSNPFKWLKAISDTKATVSGAPNFAYDLCTRRITSDQKKQLDLSSWIMACNGAEPVKFETLQNFADAFAPCGFKLESFVPGYGLAEATLYVTAARRAGIPRVKNNFVSMGKIGATQDIKIIDHEVCVKNDFVSQGYFNKPEENKLIFQEYLHTGDLGFIDDGELYITGRKKDLIIIRGRNFYPTDIENSVERASSNVRKGCVAAFSVPGNQTELLGVVAEISDESKSKETTEAIRQQITQEFDLKAEVIKLIPPKTIPKTSSGKIQRYAARELATTVSIEGFGEINEHQPLINYGLDSLMRQELLATLNLPAQTVIDDHTTLAMLKNMKPAEPPKPNPKTWNIQDQIDALQAAGIKNPFFHTHEHEKLIQFSNYNYVGLASHPEVSAAAKEAIDRYGTSVSASRLVSGERVLHQQLEHKIAEFIGVEDSIVYVGGHATNVSTIGHLFGPGDLIIHDSLSHNSILEGCKLSGARAMPFTHNDTKSLERILSQHRNKFDRALIVIEGVYSMDGDIPDLAAIVDLKKRYNAYLMVDEAHSIGVLGKTGRGLSEHAGIDPKKVDFWMGTLSKSLASCGGYIAGKHEVINYLRYTSPGFVYSVGISPPNTAAALKAIEVLEREPERLTQLTSNSELFLSLCKSRNLDTGLSTHSPVIPVIIGDSMKTLKLSEKLLSQGVNIRPIIYPAVEDRLSRLRIFMTSEHTEEQIRQTVSQIALMLPN